MKGRRNGKGKSLLKDGVSSTHYLLKLVYYLGEGVQSHSL